MLWVMLVDEKPERSSQLGHALADAGYDVVATLTGRDDLRAQIVALAPDVIIVDMQSPSRDLLENMRRIHEERPRPIVMFVDEDLAGHQILAFGAADELRVRGRRRLPLTPRRDVRGRRVDHVTSSASAT